MSFILRKNFILLLALIALVHASIPARASCCSSLATGGVGRLLRHERAMVELGVTTRQTIGSFDSDAVFNRGAPRHTPYLALEPELAMVARLFEYFEPFIKLPARVQKSDRRVGANPGDITLGARSVFAFESLMHGLPTLSVVGSVRMPTGASFSRDKDLPIEDVSGSGAWLYSLSFLVEKELWGVIFGIGYGFAIDPDYFAKRGVSSSALHSPLVTAAFAPYRDHILSLSWSMAIYERPKLDDNPIIDSDRRKMTLALAYSIPIHSHIKVNAQIGSDIPVHYLGKNFSSEAFVRLGLRFGVF